MKTSLILLKEHDNPVSIRERMDAEAAPQIVLFWPSQGHPHVDPFDLTQLVRHAESLGAALGLVTEEPSIRAAARKMGIPVFTDAVDAENAKWPDKMPARPVRRFARASLRSFRKDLPSGELFGFVNSPVRRMVVFALAVLAVLAVMLVLIPAAEVQISLPEQRQALTVPVSAVQNIPGVQISGLVPLRQMVLTLDGSGSALATGSAVRPGQAAAGLVLFLNLTDKAVIVPAQTVLLSNSTPPIIFVTGETVQVPGEKGKTVRVRIHAELAGLEGNVEPGAITRIEGPLGSQLSVLNPEPVSGGTQEVITLATDQDRESLRKRVHTDLQRQANGAFSSRLSDGDFLFPGTITKLRVVDETFTPPEGQPGDKLALTTRVEFAVFFTSQSDLRILAGLALNASMPPGTQALSDQIDIRPVSDFEVGQGQVRWQMYVERSLQPQVDASRVISIVQGKTRGQAGRLLTETFKLKQQPRIDIRPAWWPWLPFLPIRIVVKG